MHLSVRALRVLGLLLCVVVANTADLPVAAITGAWHDFTNALPNPRLPHVPLAGNGGIGLMIDARNDTHTVVGGGGGGDNSFDIYINSASFWSCGACANKLSPACCRLVPLGVVSISIAAAFPSPSSLTFSAQQRIADGRLFANFSTPGGGVFALSAFVHPQDPLAVASLQWSPGGGDPPSLHVSISAWTPPAGNAPGEPKPYKPAGTLPAPASAGCFPAPCAVTPLPGGGGVAIAASRKASAVANGTAIANPIWGAIAVALSGLPPAVGVNFSSAPPSGTAYSATATLDLPADTALSLVLGEAETGGDVDPSSSAAALAAGAAIADAAAAADAFWAEFWARSWVNLSSVPGAERLWHGAQYALAATASTDPRVPAPGLFGVWASSDEVGWNGDFTLDYNAESTFYGAFSSNHAPQVESYFPIITAWEPAARILASEQAAAYSLDCPPETLHYACHLAPWGLQSWDQTVYMHWNGHFAALPFISHWEYTANASFANSTVYPLLDGLNAWWLCSLNRTTTGPGPNDYVYHDTAGDEEHEKGVSRDPQIALALAARTLGAQLAIATALGFPAPPRIADVAAHLAPFNTDASCDVTASKWPCGPWNWTPPNGGPTLTNLSVWTAYGGAPIHNSDSFSLYPLWPAEALGGPALPMPDVAERAQNSARAYAKLAGGRPVDTFTSAVRIVVSKPSHSISSHHIYPPPRPSSTFRQVLAGQGLTFNASERPGGSVVSRGPPARAIAFSPQEVKIESAASERLEWVQRTDGYYLSPPPPHSCSTASLRRWRSPAPIAAASRANRAAQAARCGAKISFSTRTVEALKTSACRARSTKCSSLPSVAWAASSPCSPFGRPPSQRPLVGSQSKAVCSSALHTTMQRPPWEAHSPSSRRSARQRRSAFGLRILGARGR